MLELLSDRIKTKSTALREANTSLGDALSSVRQLVDESGEVSQVQSYQPYGSVLGSVVDGMTSYGFTGEWMDGNTNLVYLRARWYSPEQVRCNGTIKP